MSGFKISRGFVCGINLRIVQVRISSSKKVGDVDTGEICVFCGCAYKAPKTGNADKIHDLFGCGYQVLKKTGHAETVEIFRILRMRESETVATDIRS